MDPDRAASGERVFAQPPLVRTLSIWFAVASVLTAVSIVVSRIEGVWTNDLLQALSLAFCALSLYVSALGLRGSRDTFAATEEGLWRHSPGKSPELVRWQEIGDVYPENVMQRLVVADRRGRKRLAIEFHLQGFGELRRIILEKTGRRP